MQQEKDRANDEALHWLIALQEDEDDAVLKARFESWLSASADNRHAWEECRHVWDTLGAVGPNREKPSTASTVRKNRSTGRHLLAGLAGAMAICLAVVLQPAVSLWLSADYATGVAQTREIRLEDGSTVYLGADSAISVSFEATSRNIALLTGEAYFDVTPNPARPFKVETGSIETKVLGTAFNVRRSGTGVNVSVNHGRVAVSNEEVAENLNTPLAAGDWVNVTWDGKVERGNDAPELAGGWRTGMHVVKDRPVTEVIDEIRRHYKGTILSTDRQLAALRVTGVYNLRQPVEALNALVQAHGARVHEVTPWVAVVSRW